MTSETSSSPQSTYYVLLHTPRYPYTLLFFPPFFFFRLSRETFPPKYHIAPTYIIPPPMEADGRRRRRVMRLPYRALPSKANPSPILPPEAVNNPSLICRPLNNFLYCRFADGDLQAAVLDSDLIPPWPLHAYQPPLWALRVGWERERGQ